MIIKTLPIGPLETNCYIVGCETTGEGLIIDPASDDDTIIQQVKKLNLTIKYILLTHGHFDHCCGLSAMKREFDVPVAVHPDDIPFVAQAKLHGKMYGIDVPDIILPDTFIQEDDCFEIGTYTLRAIHTPGHTPGGVCFVCAKHLFSGDTLFSGSIGRTDLPGGNHTQIIASIKTKLYTLPDDTLVYPGHGPQTSIGDEKQYNPFTG